ncbi:hypothetical protein Pan54_37810 [Rubinisphaera italica]|uniref:Uncharacterized protein n=1 Tax=Rubinisphaera italica TaxID=2527969 RepID=A0A5C5XJ35_9PLAN|nr:hypothetical protein Pan54_37810 [Rubinisphaera italica]
MRKEYGTKCIFKSIVPTLITLLQLLNVRLDGKRMQFQCANCGRQARPTLSIGCCKQMMLCRSRVWIFRGHPWNRPALEKCSLRSIDRLEACPTGFIPTTIPRLVRHRSYRLVSHRVRSLRVLQGIVSGGNRQDFGADGPAALDVGWGIGDKFAVQ